jgi:hypothetical protein
VLKKLVVAAALAGLVASPVAAADQAPPAPLASGEIVPASEQVEGQAFFNSTAGPLIMFAIVVAIGVAIALLIKTDDEPASP